MRQSPRLRRLHSDLKAIERLKAESSILDYTVPGPSFGGSPDVYVAHFYGRGLCKADGSNEVRFCQRHEVMIRLGASYPRMMPELTWRTPIFHPNISANGVVCLGGYSTHWVPSLQLDELCTMLWDMIRYENFDVDSPYNREAALWVKEQTTYSFPVDSRPIRDKLAKSASASIRRNDRPSQTSTESSDHTASGFLKPAGSNHDTAEGPDIVFVNDEVVDAEIVEGNAGSGAPDILFIE